MSKPATAVVLYGSHGGELDREEVKTRHGRAPTGAISEATIRLAARCTLDIGDRIVIEGDRE